MSYEPTADKDNLEDLFDEAGEPASSTESSELDDILAGMPLEEEEPEPEKVGDEGEGAGTPQERHSLAVATRKDEEIQELRRQLEEERRAREAASAPRRTEPTRPLRPRVDVDAILSDVDDLDLATGGKAALAKVLGRYAEQMEKAMEANPEVSALRQARKFAELAERSPAIRNFLSNPSTREKIMQLRNRTIEYDDPDVNRQKAMLLDAAALSADEKLKLLRAAGEKRRESRRENVGALGVPAGGVTRPGGRKPNATERLRNAPDEQWGRALHEAIRRLPPEPETGA